MTNKIRKKTVIIYQDCEYDLDFESNGLRVFSSDDSVIIVDENDNVKVDITADCSQNMGFLNVDVLDENNKNRD